MVRHYLAFHGAYPDIWFVAGRGQQSLGQPLVPCQAGIGLFAGALSPGVRSNICAISKEPDPPFITMAPLLE